MPIQIHIIAFLVRLLSVLLSLLLSMSTSSGGIRSDGIQHFHAAFSSMNYGASQAVPADRVSIGRISNAVSETIEEYLPDDLVWVTEKGKRYHTISTCSGMNSPSLITQEEAAKSGRTPCKVCAYWIVQQEPEEGHP